MRRLVRELSVVGFRPQKTESISDRSPYQDKEHTVFSSKGESVDSRLGDQDRGDFPSNEKSFVSMQDGLSPSPNPIRQSTLGTVRMPTIVDYEEDDALSFNDDELFNGSGSDVPSEDTSDDGSDDEDITVDVSESWKKVTGGSDQPSHLDLFQTLADGTVLNGNFNGIREEKNNRIRMPLKDTVITMPTSTKNSPNGGLKSSPPVARSTRMSSKTNTSASKAQRKNYLLGLFNSIPEGALDITRDRGSNEQLSIFTEPACDYISQAVMNYLGMSSDPYVAIEVIKPTLMMFVDATLDQQTIMVMEEMINSSVKAYEASMYYSSAPTNIVDETMVVDFYIYLPGCESSSSLL